MTGDRLRLDQALVERGLFPSRSRAQSAIAAGLVTVDGRAALKPSIIIDPSVEVHVLGDAHDYVSRGALKLAAGLDAFTVDAAGKVCLDLGASTGGFSEVLLRRGAAKVYAVDVGHGQLHPLIASDPRVISLERVNAKDLSTALIPDLIDLLVADVSFIGLRKALPPALALLAPTAAVVALVKPQFEVGPAGVGKGGLVLNAPEVGPKIADDLSKWLCESFGMDPVGVIASPIEGGDGNKEFLVGAIRTS
jgi:23S rRNA (cytidine1920-2'-O)/16S rRNA (cytidine1409-2'-O)-methyltransferase